MGLDNGVFMRFKDKDVAIKVKEYMERISNDKVYMSDGDKDGEKIYDVELLYWRKCWNVRDVFFSIVEEDNDECEFNLTADELTDATNKIMIRLTPSTWNQDYNAGRTIWNFKECGRNYINDLEIAWRVMGYVDGLKFAYDNFKVGTDFEVEYVFYDSY